MLAFLATSSSVWAALAVTVVVTGVLAWLVWPLPPLERWDSQHAHLHAHYRNYPRTPQEALAAQRHAFMSARHARYTHALRRWYRLNGMGEWQLIGTDAPELGVFSRNVDPNRDIATVEWR